MAIFLKVVRQYDGARCCRQVSNVEFLQIVEISGRFIKTLWVCSFMEPVDWFRDWHYDTAVTALAQEIQG
jgi:hypothetical protein